MEDVVRLERSLFVPAELVFEVWTEFEHLAGWFVDPGQRLERGSAPGTFTLREAADGGACDPSLSPLYLHVIFRTCHNIPPRGSYIY